MYCTLPIRVSMCMIILLDEVRVCLHFVYKSFALTIVVVSTCEDKRESNKLLGRPLSHKLAPYFLDDSVLTASHCPRTSARLVLEFSHSYFSPIFSQEGAGFLSQVVAGCRRWN